MYEFRNISFNIGAVFFAIAAQDTNIKAQINM